MNARPVPMAETHKLALLTWLRDRARFGQGSPSDRDIQRRLGLRTTDDAMALVQALAADGDITIEREGNFRHLCLRDPLPLAGARPVTRDMAEAAIAAVPMPTAEPAPVRGKPAPISIAPPRPLSVPVVTHAPIAAPAPAPAAPPIPKEALMPTASAPPTAPGERNKIHLNVTANEHALIRNRAEAEGVAMTTWAHDAVRARLRVTSPAATPTPPAGKPRLSARVLRVAHADGRDFWQVINSMIELGATSLEAIKAGRIK